MTTEQPFCGLMLLEFGKYYAANISGYADIPICLVGVALNLLNLVVFTRKNMISPAGVIFKHLALADLLVLLGCIPFVWYEYIRESDSSAEQNWDYEWLVFTIHCTNFIAMMHSISIWLTVMLMIWRYIAVVHPSRESAWCSLKMTRNVVFVGYIFCILIFTPVYFAHEIRTEIVDEKITYSAKFKDNAFLYAVIFITNGLLLKLLPSLVLTFFSFRLILTLVEIKKQHKLISPSKIQTAAIRNIETTQIVDRSTTILMTVLMLFLIAEVPLGTLSLFNAIYGNGIHHECYDLLGRIFDTITLLNTSITFFVYYILNQRFRTTFKYLFNRNTSNSSQEDTLMSYDFSMNTNTSQA